MSEAVTLRRKSWPILTWGGIFAVWVVYPFGVHSSLKHDNFRDVWLVLAAFLVVTAVLRRIGSCRVRMLADKFAVENLFFTYQVPYALLSNVDGGAASGIEMVTHDGSKISPFGFGGSLVDSFFKTSERAAGIMRGRMEVGTPLSSETSELRRTFRWCWTSDVPFALALVSTIVGALIS